MKYIIVLCSMWLSLPAYTQQKIKGALQLHTDVGNPKLKGSASYDKKSGIYTIAGSGYNIWFNRDEFQYVYKEISGDFTLTANFAFTGTGTDPHRKIGWMVRNSLADTGIHASAVLHGDGLTVMQWRLKPGMNMRDPEDELFAKEKKLYGVIQLQRRGNNYSMRVAEKEGDTMQLVGEQTLKDFNATVLAGIFICSHNPGVLEHAKAWNVHIEK